MIYLKWKSRALAFGTYCFLFGGTVMEIGTTSEAMVYTSWSIIRVSLTILAIMLMGFFAGIEHQKEKDAP